jgi:hypothetical protein
MIQNVKLRHSGGNEAGPERDSLASVEFPFKPPHKAAFLSAVDRVAILNHHRRQNRGEMSECPVSSLRTNRGHID